MKGHAESALEHLISALREENIVIHTYSQGEFAPAGLSYNVRTGQRLVAGCCWEDGLHVEADASPRLACLIRSHCALYYAIYPGR
jgi:hypothetical protein